MKTKKNFSLALSLAMAMVLTAFAAGCGTYQVQGSYKVGPSIDQQAPIQVVDANGNVRTKAPEQAQVDLVGLGDVRFGQRSMQGAGTLHTPASQVQIRETRTVREEIYQDKRGCPDKSQIKEVKTGDVKRTETFTRIENHPSETVGLNTNLAADDGPGTKLVGKGMDMGASFLSNGLYGLLRRPDQNNNTTTQNGGGATATGGSAFQAQGQRQGQVSNNTNLNLNRNANINANRVNAVSGSSSSATGVGVGVGVGN